MQLSNEQANRKEKKRPRSHTHVHALPSSRLPTPTMLKANKHQVLRPALLVIFTRPISHLALLLTLKLLDTLVVLAGHEGEGHDAGDVHLRAEDVHVEAELDADGLDVLEALLVVGAGAAHPDLHLVLVEQRRDLAQGADDALEGGGDLGEMLVALRLFARVT